MAKAIEEETCALCKRGVLKPECRTISIRQLTDRGYVQCLVTVPVAVCNDCGSETFLQRGEQLIETAIAAEYARKRSHD